MRAPIAAILAGALIGLGASAARAQSRRPAATPPVRAGHEQPMRAGPAQPGDAGAHVPARVSAPPAAPPSTRTEPAGDSGVVEAKTLDGGTRSFKFSELEIEGRLKSPQLVYFLRRVRGEFAAEGLGHRTFVREMSETRKESSF
jgi:hypothetical protein